MGQGFYNSWEALHKPPVVACYFNKAPNLDNWCGSCLITNNLNLRSIYHNAILGHYVTQWCYRLKPKLALRVFSMKWLMSKSLGHNSQLLLMISFALRVYKNISDEQYYKQINIRPEYLLFKVYKCSRVIVSLKYIQGLHNVHTES